MIITITGLSGSGKTELAEYLKTKGYKTLDADKVGHRVLSKEKNQIVKLFGKDILTPKGNISRSKLKKIVFSDEKQLKKLNRLVHPLMKKKIKALVDRSEDLLIDAALVEELGLDKLSDKILLIRNDKPKKLEFQCEYQKPDAVVMNTRTKQDLYKRGYNIIQKWQKQSTREVLTR